MSRFIIGNMPDCFFFISHINPSGEIADEQEYGFEVSEFGLQSNYYVHFPANTLQKGMNPISMD